MLYLYWGEFGEMKIPLINTNLEINFSLSRTPKLKKLEIELKEFFNNNLIEGRKIEEFGIENISSGRVNIIPLNPRVEGQLEGGVYSDEIKSIGQKYGIRHLGFIYGCYHK